MADFLFLWLLKTFCPLFAMFPGFLVLSYPCGQQHKNTNQSTLPHSPLITITPTTTIIRKSNKFRSHSPNMYHGSSALGIYKYASNDGYDSICLNHEPFQTSTCSFFRNCRSFL